jgi:hypothetical protein
VISTAANIIKDATIPQSVEIPKIRRIAKGKVRGALAE